jgi:uncharacterized protein (DUF58 family)
MRNLLWPFAALLLAFFLAYASSAAHRYGYLESVSVLSVAALALVGFAIARMIPALLNRLGFTSADWFQDHRITPRGAFCIFLTLLMAVSISVVSNNLLILVLSFLLASLLVSGLISNLVLYGLKVVLSLPEAIHAKQRTVLFLTLRNLKRGLPSFALGLSGHSQDASSRVAGADFFGQEAFFPYIRGGESQTLKVHCSFQKRGSYFLDGFEVKTRFPFGFFTRRRSVSAEGKITVYPALIPLERLLTYYPFLRGRDSQNRKGSGMTLFNIRDYQRGDDARLIHWKSSGKLSRLLVREFVEEEDVWIHLLFSTYLPDENGDSKEQFEKAVSYVTSVACFYRKQERPFTFDSGEFQVSVGVDGAKFENLMSYLADVEPASRMLLDLEAAEDSSILFAAGKSVKFRRLHGIDYLQL